MKSNGIAKAMGKLKELGFPGKSADALAAAETAGQVPESPAENEGGPRETFEEVPALLHRPDLTEQLDTGFFDGETGLPCVAMDNFPMPRDEEETNDAEFVI